MTVLKMTNSASKEEITKKKIYILLPKKKLLLKCF